VHRKALTLTTLLVLTTGAWLFPITTRPAGAAVTPTFSMTPAHGPPGTVVDLRSVTPCLAPPGATNWHARIFVGFGTTDDIGAGETLTAPVGPDGSWEVTITPLGVTGAAFGASCIDDQGDSLSYSSAPQFLVTTTGNGFWLANRSPASDGSLPLGEAYAIANLALPAGQVFVGMAADPPTGAGLWFVASNGGVFSYGDATFEGSAFSLKLTAPIVGMAATPDGKGYWLVAADGGVFTYGDAAFKGSAGALKLKAPIVGMAATPDGKGYWLVAADGGVFTYGDAAFAGSAGALRLNKAIVGMAATPDGRGYWLVAADGGVFSYGDAVFEGSAGALTLARPIVGMAATTDGKGYWLAAGDGGVFNYGDAPFYGSWADIPNTPPYDVFAIAATPATVAG
jgi:hypothetical protein